MKPYQLEIEYLAKDHIGIFILRVADILIVAVCFLLAGFILSTFLNDELTRPLDRNQSKLKIFGEVIAESLLTMALIILILYLVPKIPSIDPKENASQEALRVRAADILISFAILACQNKFQEKIKHLLQDNLSKESKTQKDMLQNYRYCLNNPGQDLHWSEVRRFSCMGPP